MCGIVGYFGNVARDLKAASDCIAHRGPDMQGIKSGVEWKVAFNRLSILDLSDNGMQPFIFDGVHVYLNGEIYNFKELATKYKLNNLKSNIRVPSKPFLRAISGDEQIVLKWEIENNGGSPISNVIVLVYEGNIIKNESKIVVSNDEIDKDKLMRA